jgi:hypothetical protein
MDAVSTAEGPGTPPVTRTCAECGREFEQRRRGRPSVYCRPACRQRAWALRQARATLDAADGVATLTVSETTSESEEPLPSPPTPSPAVAPRSPPTAPQSPPTQPLPPTRPLAPARPAVRGRAGAVQPVPTDARGWVLLLKHLREQLNDPGSDVARRPWEHARLYDGLGQALTALDAATPGGLAWLERND